MVISDIKHMFLYSFTTHVFLWKWPIVFNPILKFRLFVGVVLSLCILDIKSFTHVCFADTVYFMVGLFVLSKFS